jgi:hypothetical protein
MATYTEQLTEVNTAITNILSAGQYIKRGEGVVQQALLKDLIAERKRLEPLARAEAAGILTNTGEPVVRYGIPVRSR